LIYRIIGVAYIGRENKCMWPTLKFGTLKLICVNGYGESTISSIRRLRKVKLALSLLSTITQGQYGVVGNQFLIYTQTNLETFDVYFKFDSYRQQ